MMKRYMQFPALLMVTFVLLTAIITGCKKNDDNGLVFGKNYIYMPQALQSGGIDLTYAVPSGLDSATRNYVIDSTAGTVNIILGVSRSGMQSSGGYTVDVASNQDTVNAAIASGAIQAVALPDKDYTLPSSVVVPAGQYAATFYLSIDIDQLKAFAGKKVAVAVKLNNPSAYALNAEYSETILIIDVDALNL